MLIFQRLFSIRTLCFSRRKTSPFGFLSASFSTMRDGDDNIINEGIKSIGRMVFQPIPGIWGYQYEPGTITLLGSEETLDALPSTFLNIPIVKHPMSKPTFAVAYINKTKNIETEQPRIIHPNDFQGYSGIYGAGYDVDVTNQLIINMLCHPLIAAYFPKELDGCKFNLMAMERPIFCHSIISDNDTHFIQFKMDACITLKDGDEYGLTVFHPYVEPQVARANEEAHKQINFTTITDDHYVNMPLYFPKQGPVKELHAFYANKPILIKDLPKVGTVHSYCLSSNDGIDSCLIKLDEVFKKKNLLRLIDTEHLTLQPKVNDKLYVSCLGEQIEMTVTQILEFSMEFWGHGFPGTCLKNVFAMMHKSGKGPLSQGDSGTLVYNEKNDAVGIFIGNGVFTNSNTTLHFFLLLENIIKYWSK